MAIKKKLAALITAAAAAFSVIPNPALANDYEYEFRNFVANVVIPQSGLCDFAKSYAGHENEITASEYFSGIISAFRMDIDADGNSELILVGDNLIRVYRISEGQPTFCASYIIDLVCDYGESFANVFVKNYNGRDYLCAESFIDTGSEKSYKLKMMYVDAGGVRLLNQVSVEKTYRDDYEYESASMTTPDKNTSYSQSTNKGITTSTNPDGYNDLYDAAWQMLYNSGFTEPSFINTVNRLILNENNTDMYFRVTDLISDVTLKTYVRASGIRTNSHPVVYFEDHSELSALNIAPAATQAPTEAPTEPPSTEPADPTETPAPPAETPDVTPEIINVTIDGTPLVFADQPACIINDRTLVPVRAVLEKIGCKVDWLHEYRMVVAVKDNLTMNMKIDDATYYVNNEPRTLDVPAQIINDRTMIPARACAETFGCTVDWDPATRTVVIVTPDYVQPTETPAEVQPTEEPPSTVPDESAETPAEVQPTEEPPSTVPDEPAETPEE